MNAVSKRTLNYRVWLRELAISLSIGTGFYLIDNIAIKTGVEIPLEMKIMLLIGQVGYIFIAMIDLITCAHPKYWIYHTEE